MTETAPRPAAIPRTTGSEGGFTLLEVLIALGIMTFSLTALLGALSVAVGTRRGAEMRTRAAILADRVLQDVETTMLAEHPIPLDWRDEKELAIEAGEPVLSAEFPGMRYSVEFVTSGERPDLVLVQLRIAWRDDGEDDGETFVRILPRAVPMTRRVAQRRNS